jgi:ATP-binding cassette subfamily G (WHITE) protein 2 (SNQ2)
MATTGSGSWALSAGQGHGHEILDTSSKAGSKASSRNASIATTSSDGGRSSPTSKADDWKLMSEVKQFHAADKADGRSLGVTWNNLTVKGISADTVFNENAFSQFNILQKVREARQAAPLRTLIDSSYGCVKPGEMLLVLGRPGSGCTTLLKMLSNRRAGYAKVEGDVHFGSMTHKEAESYRGQIAMNTEEELFFPTLTVGQTMDFATRLKVPDQLLNGVSSREEYRAGAKDFLVRSMGIAHTDSTMVGNEFV